MKLQDSILLSIKKLLGLGSDYTPFDTDIIIHINSVFFILKQLGVGPSEGYTIEDEGNTWDEFLDGSINLELVKSYIYLKVKTLFDPPSSSIIADSYRRSIEEYEWRLNSEIERHNMEG